jgi:hypothetical protein
VACSVPEQRGGLAVRPFRGPPHRAQGPPEVDVREGNLHEGPPGQVVADDELAQQGRTGTGEHRAPDRRAGAELQQRSRQLHATGREGALDGVPGPGPPLTDEQRRAGELGRPHRTAAPRPRVPRPHDENEPVPGDRAGPEAGQHVR